MPDSVSKIMQATEPAGAAMPDGNDAQNRVVAQQIAETAITVFTAKHPEPSVNLGRPTRRRL